ncbi:MAG: hypothetical protein M3N95_07060 [Actinomycetota bacterium]|nr:hypothetical protein [Actinomycetota bacterium]
MTMIATDTRPPAWMGSRRPQISRSHDGRPADRYWTGPKRRAGSVSVWLGASDSATPHGGWESDGAPTVWIENGGGELTLGQAERLRDHLTKMIEQAGTE